MDQPHFASDGASLPGLTTALLEVARQVLEAPHGSLIALLRPLPRRVLGHGTFHYHPADDDADAPAGMRAAVSCFGRPAGHLCLLDAPGSPLARALLDATAELLGAALQREDEQRLADQLNLERQRDRIYFEQLFAASPEAIVVLDGQDRVVRVNREFERLFGFTAEEALGRTINELIVPDGQQEDAIGLTHKVAAGEQVQHETIRRRKDGSIVNVSILGSPIIDQGNQVAVYGIYRDITAQKETEEALRRLSTTDDLTGLFNRRGFFLLAEQQRRLALRKNAELLLLYLDIDDFKNINDSHGHLVGDQVLADLAQILRRCYRDSDILARMDDESSLLARMGGDEFVILAVDAGTQGETILTERLRERLKHYNETSGYPFAVSLSVGPVRVGPEPERSIDSVLAEADRLMYEDKRGRLRL